MSLQEKVENYVQTMQAEDNFSSLGNEIIEDIKQLINDISKKEISPDQKNIKIEELWKAYLTLPDQIFYNHSQELLEALLDNVPQSIYKTFSDSKIDLSNKGNIEIEPQSLEDVIILMLISYLKKVSAKEVLLYLRAFLEKKNKNLQLTLLYSELLCWVLKHITKKEVFLPDLLPSLSHLLQKGLAKYVKYKRRIENKEYTEVPEQIQEYVSHYEIWIRSIVSKLMRTIQADFDNLIKKKDNVPFIMISDLYDKENQYNQKNNLEKEKCIVHYYILFILDTMNIVLDHRISGLSQETAESVLQDCKNILSYFNNSTQNYISNFLSQIKIKERDESITPYNTRDNHYLLVGPYHALSTYNTISMSYIVVQFIKMSNEASLLSAEYKLKLLLPCLNELFRAPQQFELKEEAMNVFNILLDSLIVQYGASNKIENLNIFNIPLDKVLEKLLDYSGGPVDPIHRKLGIDIFAKVKQILSEKALAKLLLIIINTTTNYALSGHLVIEFKAGISNALRSSGGGADIKDSVSPFLNINYLRVFFELGLFQNSSKFKNDNDLIGSCINTLMLIYLKYLNLIKNVEGYMNLEFQDHCNLFKPGNLRVVLHYGEKAMELQKKINDDLEMLNKQLEEMKQEPSANPNLEVVGMRFNSLIVIYESISRIEECHHELKGLLKI